MEKLCLDLSVLRPIIRNTVAGKAAKLKLILLANFW